MLNNTPLNSQPNSRDSLCFLLAPAFTPCWGKRSLSGGWYSPFSEAGESLHLFRMLKVQRLLLEVKAVVCFPELRLMREDLYPNRHMCSKGRERWGIKFTVSLTCANKHVSEICCPEENVSSWNSQPSITYIKMNPISIIDTLLPNQSSPHYPVHSSA